MIERTNPQLSVSRQCELLGIARSTVYYEPKAESEENLGLMRLLDEQYTQTPFYGVRRMTAWLRREGYVVNPKRVSRLLRKMGLWAIYPGPTTSKARPEHRIYPYLLRNVPIREVNQVWSTDITYVRMHRGFCYLVAVIDWFSRYVLSWEVATSLEASFCLEALDRALVKGSDRPQVFNSDQGAQFTSLDFTARLLAHDISISMDGRGKGAGQHIRGEVMAECEARGGVYQRLPERGRSGERVGAVLRLLQPPAVAPVAIVPDTGGHLLAGTAIMKSIVTPTSLERRDLIRLDSTHLSRLSFYLNFAQNLS